MANNPLQWPLEAASSEDIEYSWHDGGVNRVLDFHGDPNRAKLVVFSDGNHHMALEACLKRFVEQNPGVEDVFYVTLPPGILSSILQAGHIRLGSLRLNLSPHIFISPEPALTPWIEKGRLSKVKAFARSQGQAWLVRKGNPLRFESVRDILRPEIRFFISNPETEKASHEVYRDTLLYLAQQEKLDADRLAVMLREGNRGIVHGRHVHHREAPQAVISDQADATLVYYHLALRYVRIFPDQFDMIPLPDSGTPEAVHTQPTTEYFVSIVDGGNEWAERFHDFLTKKEAASLYREHGLGSGDGL